MPFGSPRKNHAALPASVKGTHYSKDLFLVVCDTFGKYAKPMGENVRD